MAKRRRQTRPADAYAWPAVLGLAVVIRLGVLVALPEFFAWRVTLPIAVLHTACDLAAMALLRAIAGEATGTPSLGTLAAALFALHPHLVFETLSTRHTAIVLVMLHAVIWLVVRWYGRAQRLGAAAALVAAASGVALAIWADESRDRAGEIAMQVREATAAQRPRVERADVPEPTAPLPADPVVEYGQTVDAIFRGAAGLLALAGAWQLRSRAAVVLLVIPPLVCTGAVGFGRQSLNPSRAPLVFEPLLLVLAAAGLAVLARWWSPPRPSWRPVDTPDYSPGPPPGD